MGKNDKRMVSLRIPRDAWRKLQRAAEGADLSMSRQAALFLEAGCQQPPRRGGKGAMR